MPTQIHLLLAYVSGLVTLLLAAEAGWRAIHNAPSSALSSWISGGQLVAVATTSIFGLALVTFGAQPSESVHYLLALAALALPPAASILTHGTALRTRAAATALSALIALGAVALLFMTG